jgi:hypothetical protein
VDVDEVVHERLGKHGQGFEHHQRQHEPVDVLDCGALGAERVAPQAGGHGKEAKHDLQTTQGAKAGRARQGGLVCDLLRHGLFPSTTVVPAAGWHAQGWSQAAMLLLLLP